MEYKNIKELMDIFNSSELSSLSLKQKDFSLILEKKMNSPENSPEVKRSANIDINNDIDNSKKNKNANVSSENKYIPEHDEDEKSSNCLSIKSPLVGVFYHRGAPEKEPFVKIGIIVKKGDVIGVIEAMKMINEIKSPYDGKITKIIAQDEQLVSFDQTLMEIEV